MAILDAYSRKCVGWKLSRRIDGQLALDALEAALATRDVSPRLIHHSDRGVQYASTAYVDRLTQVGGRVSMSAVGNPYDNAKAESFFKTLKHEEVYLKQYQTLQEAEADIQHFIEEVYNSKRLHSSLGSVPPVEFEIAYAQEMRCSLAPWSPPMGAVHSLYATLAWPPALQERAASFLFPLEGKGETQTRS